MTVHKRIYIDVETTGVDVKDNGIIQLSGIIEIDDKEVERCDFNIKPFDTDSISTEALAVNGQTMESIRAFTDAKKVHDAFVKLLCKYVDKYSRFDKFQFIGYNAKFDCDFIRAFFEKNADKFYGSLFWTPAIDVMNMAAVRLEDIRSTMPDFKLMTVAKEFGINVDESKLHDAMYDIEIIKKLFDILSQ